MDNKFILEMNHIEKDFFGNQVLKDVSIKVKPGEIVALIGENGAGKSTIMNILFGMPAIHQTGGFKGEVIINGEKVDIKSPIEAMKHGIGMVHQEFMLIDGYDVAENVKLNRENLKKTPLSLIFGKRLNLVDQASMHKDARTTLDSLGIDLGEQTRVGSLPVGYKQFVEIARELDKQNTRLIVLDEPTAVLTESEAETFLSCVRSVAEKGIAFIFISHKLDEVKNNSHHVFVLRDGEMVGDYHTKELNTIRMSELMVGRKVEILNRQMEDEDPSHQEICLELEHFGVSMPGEIARDITLQVKKGEIFGIGGLAGHGKISIANGIMGLYPSRGQVKINGKIMDVTRTDDTLDAGVAFVSEDRRGSGLMLDESIELNIAIAALKTKNRFVIKRLGIPFYDKKGAIKYAEKMIQELDIRCTGHSQPVRSLSGGNQQKVCIARALTLDPDILFVSEPTRGIDIGAKKMILDSLMKLNKEKGVTVIITSSELAELRSVCNRIAIVTEGRIAGILSSTDEDYKFGMLMSGAKYEEPGAAQGGDRPQDAAAAQGGDWPQDAAAAQGGDWPQDAAAAQEGGRPQNTAAAQEGGRPQNTAAAQGGGQSGDVAPARETERTVKE